MLSIIKSFRNSVLRGGNMRASASHENNSVLSSCLAILLKLGWFFVTICNLPCTVLSIATPNHHSRLIYDPIVIPIAFFQWHGVGIMIVQVSAQARTPGCYGPIYGYAAEFTTYALQQSVVFSVFVCVMTPAEFLLEDHIVHSSTANFWQITTFPNNSWELDNLTTFPNFLFCFVLLFL